MDLGAWDRPAVEGGAQGSLGAVRAIGRAATADGGGCCRGG